MSQPSDGKVNDRAEQSLNEQAEELFQTVFAAASWPSVIGSAGELWSSSAELQRAVAILCAKDLMVHKSSLQVHISQTLLDNLLLRQLPFDSEDILVLLRLGNRTCESWDAVSFNGILKAVKDFARRNEVSDELCAELDTFAKGLTFNGLSAAKNASKTAAKLARKLDPEKFTIEIVAQEAWSDAALADLNSLDESLLALWLPVLNHALNLTATKPSAKWSTEAQKLLAALGVGEFQSRISHWFPLVGKRGTKEAEFREWEGDPNDLICAQNADLLKGLVWFCASIKEDSVAQLLGNVGEQCFKKVKNVGPRCPKVGNACVGTLSVMTTKEAIAQISRLGASAKNSSSKKQIEKGLGNAAERAGMSVDELQEISVPDYGFTEIGRLVEQLGECRAEVCITGVNSAELRWFDKSRKQLASVPAEVKKEHADRAKALKKLAADIQTMLPSIRLRIESSLLQQRHWNYTAWRERYLDHPICGAIARRLIWQINGKAGIWSNGEIVDSHSSQLKFDPQYSMVELWHPVAAAGSEVQEWRDWLQQNQVTQPFKQAHREIYVLTDAERQTATYSNRFAAHIIRQHQFAQLCKERGWRYTLQGQWDSHNIPELHLPNWDMTVQFHVDPAIEDTVSQASVYMHLSTDQVRFVRGERNPIPLTEILPIVFTEVMRDVDLFVGVCSIGNDPNWVEGGHYYNYWQNTSFGDLGASAQTRKQVLETILPRTKIADRCSFNDKFVVVKGDLRTYNIHLGSGNILMEPNSQYLCIVPASAPRAAGQSANITLPFEGDHMLSVILSKCFLLANDRAIKDPTITAQIARK